MNIKYDSEELLEEIRMAMKISGKDSYVNVVSTKVDGLNFVIDYYGGNGEYDGIYEEVVDKTISKVTLDKLLEKIIVQISNI